MGLARPGDNALPTTDLHVEATYRLTEALVEVEGQMRRRVELVWETGQRRRGSTADRPASAARSGAPGQIDEVLRMQQLHGE